MKFSIRDLLLVTVIVALAVGWCVDHERASRLATENARLKESEAFLEMKTKLLRGALEAVTDRKTAAGVESGGPATLYAPEYYAQPKSQPPAPNPPQK